MDSILARLPQTGWAAQCITKFRDATNMTQGLVDGDGNPVASFDSNTWGVTYSVCERYCNRGLIPQYFNFDTFSSGATNYLLPWLALTAQLPYETGTPGGDVMSFCLAVGSPALITYSLTLTILNRFWIQQQFDKLYDDFKHKGASQRYDGYGFRIRNMQYFLQEAQQISIRASQSQGWLSSLIVLPQNNDWWEKLKGRLQTTRRDVTASLIWQMFVAIVAYSLTSASSFLALLGNESSALQIASGTLWVWLVPVIGGWILVGTQIGTRAIPHAIRAEKAHRAPLIKGDAVTNLETQNGIEMDSALTPQPSNAKDLTIPNWLGASVTGDERRTGPIYNYARVLTWLTLSESFVNATRTTINNIQDGKTSHVQMPISDQNPTQVQISGQNDILLKVLTSTQSQNSNEAENRGGWDDSRKAEENLAGNAEETAKYCDLNQPAARHSVAYVNWENIPSRVITHIIVASMMAVLIQWGTTGPAILIAYLTPAKGLGCRSGGYLFYGSFATIVWFCLLASMLLSHAAMLRYQQVLIQNPGIRFEDHKRGWALSILCGAAVITRHVGKLIAVLNAIWLILSSFFEFTGVYESCWCNADSLGMGDKGWVFLFKTTADIKQAATTPWAGGIAISTTVWVVSLIVFYFGTRNSEGDK